MQECFTQLKSLHGKEEGDASGLNQAFDRFVALESKRNLSTALQRVLRHRTFNGKNMSQWDLLSIATHCVREVQKKGNVWCDSFKAVNMHPHHTLQLKGWLQKIEKVLIKGEQYSDEGHITPISLLPVWYQNWPAEKKKLAIATIDEGGGWSSPTCVRALCSACGLDAVDLQAYISCYFVEKYANEGPPTFSESDLEDALPASLKKAQTACRQTILEHDAFTLHPKRMLPSPTDCQEARLKKNEELFKHMCRRRARLADPSKVYVIRSLTLTLSLKNPNPKLLHLSSFIFVPSFIADCL